MLCWGMKNVLQAVTRCGCLVRTSLHSYSSLTLQQTCRARGLLSQPQVSSKARVPPLRMKIIFTTKKRKFLPRYKKDGVSPSLTLIYENNMHRYYFWSQLIINALGVPSITLCAYIIASEWHQQDFSITGGLLTATIYLLFYGFLMTVINGLCRRSILRIYADADAKNFTAVMKDWKLTTRKIDFDMTQVACKPPGQFLGIFHGNVSIRNRPFMVAPTDFVQPVFYNKFLGYDLHRSIELEGIKDIDLKDYMHRPALDDKTVTAKKKRVG